ncbi:hypothetical protein VHEMI04397 [[Torrubiella] hemipterigena]|uniref:F-box domain-containing protein n=1 Tax=[Torrubiella] hemipterigena TaxID=1531966 RepID=A0A0A1T142_9HYPO|nr:hypothetical protein VHEMI04397 [[Torrubiella] hemipterigena]
MRPLLQRNLEATNGVLTLGAAPDPYEWRERPPPPAIVRPPKAYISRLPAELLTQVFEHIHREQYSYSSFLQLPSSHVNHAFYNASHIFLYRKIEPCVSNSPRKLPLLCRTLREKPMLGNHIRELSINFNVYASLQREDLSCDMFEMLVYVLDHAPLTQSLDIYSCFSRHGSVLEQFFLSALSKLPQLQSCRVRGYSEPLLCSSELYTSLNQAKWLKSLKLDRSDYAEKVAGIETPPTTIERSGSITELYLFAGEDRRKGVAQILRWPKSLKRLKVEAQAGYGYQTDLRFFFEALSIQGDSLEELHIGYLDDKIGSHLDLSPFTALRTLTVSRWSFPYRDLEFSESLAKGLLAPQLVEFYWNFNMIEQTQPDLSSLTAESVTWIHKFGLFAAKQGAKLKRIKIKFEPQIEGISEVYTWELLDPVKEDLALHGIELDFDRPFATKQAFLDYMQGMRDDEAYWERKDEEEAEAERARKARMPKDILISYQEWIRRSPENAATPEEEEPDFSSREFHLVEGKDIREYFPLAPALANDSDAAD